MKPGPPFIPATFSERTMKNIVLLSLLALQAGSALASFEMALVLDRGTKKVHRFDALSGAYLGSFGNFSATVASIAINQTKGEAMIFDPGAPGGNGAVAYYYNYNTGLLNYAATNLSSLIVSMGYSPDFASSRISLSSSIYRSSFDRNVGAETSYTLAGPAGRSTISGPQNLTVKSGSATIQHFDDTAGTAIGVSGTATAAVNDISSSTMVFASGRVGAAALANGSIQHYYTSAVGVTMNTSVAAGQFASATGVSDLHNGFVAVGKSAAGAALIQTYALATGGATASSSRLIPMLGFSGGGITDPIDVATVVAPEPASMTLIGLGAACLLRRRKR